MDGCRARPDAHHVIHRRRVAVHHAQQVLVARRRRLGAHVAQARALLRMRHAWGPPQTADYHPKRPGEPLPLELLQPQRAIPRPDAARSLQAPAPFGREP